MQEMVLYKRLSGMLYVLSINTSVVIPREEFTTASSRYRGQEEEHNRAGDGTGSGRSMKINK